MRIRIAGLMLGAIMATAGNAHAQVAWEAPLFASPQPARGFGVYVADMAGGDIGVMATWQATRAPNRLELRFGVADNGGPEFQDDSDMSGFAGLNISGLLARSSADMPLDVSWVAGAGVGFGSWAIITLPVGVSAGHTFKADGFDLTPYVTPRLVFDATMGLEDPFGGDADQTDLGFVMDLGVDVALNRGWLLRFGASLGDHEAVAFGIVF